MKAELTVREEDYYFVETEEIPNNPLLPLVIYRSALRDRHDLAGLFEKTFRAYGWIPAWRYGIYDYAHYHSTAHEVVGAFRGHATVLFGHTDGLTTTLKAGDVVIIPACVGHQCLESSGDFEAVGAYPEGQRPDLIRDEPDRKADAIRRIDHVPLPALDPVFGPDGPLASLW